MRSVAPALLTLYTALARPLDQTALDHVVATLSDLVASEVETGIRAVHAHELALGSRDPCFSSAAGAHLRARCCTYYSALAAALIEARFGFDSSMAEVNATKGVGRFYGLMAAWFLQPPAQATDDEKQRARKLAREAAHGGFRDGMSGLHSAAGRLPGPLGRYWADIAVGGVRGTLWRCEAGTVHTFLVFRPAGPSAVSDADVLLDVTLRQNLLVADWLEDRHYEACAADGLLAAEPDWWVGTAEQLGGLLSADSLRENMRRVYEAAGDDLESAPWADERTLQYMHTLRNAQLYAIDSPARRAQRCRMVTR